MTSASTSICESNVSQSDTCSNGTWPYIRSCRKTSKTSPNANIREADKKHKSGVKPPLVHTIYLSVDLARFTWDEFTLGEGIWKTCLGDHEWSVDIANTGLSLAGFIFQIQGEFQILAKRPVVKDWILPSGNGNWTVSHVNPRKQGPQEVVEWSEQRLISKAIENGIYTKARGSKKVTSVWLNSK